MITPLQYDQFNRETWGDFDAAVIAQLASLAYDSCYKPKLYKAPDSTSELIANNGYVSYGLSITSGALIYGLYTYNSSSWVVQVTDMSLDHQLFSEPVPVALLNNNQKSSGFPNLLTCPHPVVGTGVFRVQLWNNSGGAKRVQMVFGCFEPVGEVC